MSAFSRIWNNEVKKLAQECATIPLISLEEWYKLSEEKDLSTAIKDHEDGMFYISDIILLVERALAHGMEPTAQDITMKVYLLLKSPNLNTYKKELSSDEYQNMMRLRTGLEKLL